MEIQTTADQLLYSTFRLTACLEGTPVSNGTGFYFRYTTNNSSIYLPVIVTNKHVIEDADAVQIRMHMKNESGSFIEEGHLFTIDVSEGVINHPDPDVDLCLIRPGGILGAALDKKQPFAVALNEENIPSEDDWGNFDSVEGVWMIGCPNGIYDSLNNLPITRSGITASTPRLPYKGKEEFVVDMACFPGSSGSPISRAPSAIRYDRKTRQTQIGADRRGFLLGILYSGPQITNSGTIVLNNTPRVDVSTMMHLGYAIRSTRLLDFKPIINQVLSAQGAENYLP